MKLAECISKDGKLLLVLLAIPILVQLGLCYFLGGVYIENIPFGIANLDNSSLSRTIVQSFENHPGLDVNYYAVSEIELQDAIKAKKIIGGIIIPNNFSQDLSQKKMPKVILLIDGTNLLLANNAQGYSSAILGTFNAQFQLNIFEGKNMLPQAAKQAMAAFAFKDRTLYDPQLSYMCYLTYVATLLIIQFFYLIIYLLPALIEEKKFLANDKISLKVLILRGKSLLVRTGTMWITICISSFTGLCLCGRIYSLPVRGNILAYFILMIIFLLALTVMGLVLISFLNKQNYTYFVEFYSIIYTLFILTSGAVWPEYMMPAGFSQVVKCIWPYIHVANAWKYLSLKGIGWDILWPYIRNGLLFSIAWLVIAIFLHAFKIYRKKKNPLAN
ncbi:Inner membrane transport permease YbhR [Pelotomaculum schinkii]|uniref:Inner membrane transport permease YbhR n=1 Tax=Pelotomaculum schinkii TaxID=78350 RepID=A0A4Y7RG34_9FIRM|nr:ABC transporter permease [Pelotomaculum schinkii]TEB07954.1 Inner membrane transport permease YbhR [Pelotomaculum schinkii]